MIDEALRQFNLGFPTNPINALEASYGFLGEAALLAAMFPTNPINALEASGVSEGLVRNGAVSNKSN